ncbi:CDP-diacylglycerol--glycerol-3-phosphate 3-phosphatidyltransferase [Candidatus Omnitrophota bacterium]
MNLPNKLTIIRIFLAFLFMFVLLAFKGIGPKVLALVIFTLACATDFLDGYIAREYNLVTNFGKFMDPLADKLLVLAAFIAFVELRVIAAWMVLLIFSRELIVTGIRLFAVKKKKVLAAEREGKHKTASQMFAIFMILGYLLIKEIFVRLSAWTSTLESICRVGILLLMTITIALTLSSGISFLMRNRRLLYD